MACAKLVERSGILILVVSSLITICTVKMLLSMDMVRVSQVYLSSKYKWVTKYNRKNAMLKHLF